MKLFLLAAALGLSSAQIAVTCSKANQICCNGFADLYNKGNIPCKNEGTVAGLNTAEQKACVSCMGANILAIRTLVVSGKCTSQTLNDYCGAIPFASSAPAPVTPTPPTPVTPVGPTKPTPGKPTLVSGPGGTMLNCNQYLVDSCCQWGMHDPTAIGYDPNSLTCKPCLAGAIAGLRKALVSKECTAADIAYYCDVADWDVQMQAAEAAAGFTPYAVPSTCSPMPGNVSGAPAPVTPTPPTPVTPTPPVSTCTGKKAGGCKKDTACEYWQKTKECFDVGTVPCDYFKKSQCNAAKPRCEFKKKKCSKVKVIATCGDITAKKACVKSQFGCFYLKKTFPCMSKTMACSDVDNITDNKGAAITWKNAQKACKKATGSGCKYNKKLKKCYDPNAAAPAPTPGVVVGCAAWATKNDCRRGGCKWRAQKCS